MPKRKKLTLKQSIFVKEYIKQRNGAEAARKAGYAEKYADDYACQLLRFSQVKQAIERAEKKLEHRLDCETEDLTNEVISVIENSNIYDFVQMVNGRCLLVKDPKDLTIEQQRCVHSIKETSHGIEVKLYDKTKYLELLGKWKGLDKNTEDNKDVSITLNYNLKKNKDDSNGKEKEVKDSIREMARSLCNTNGVDPNQ